MNTKDLVVNYLTDNEEGMKKHDALNVFFRNYQHFLCILSFTNLLHHVEAGSEMREGSHLRRASVSSLDTSPQFLLRRIDKAELNESPVVKWITEL